ncbi:hypothetical protein TNCV_4357371 [Trichonephila clavipes]|nr:hypothetical protein TNCV_4357371 [Trichonephila clavipes]
MSEPLRHQRLDGLSGIMLDNRIHIYVFVKSIVTNMTTWGYIDLIWMTNFRKVRIISGWIGLPDLHTFCCPVEHVRETLRTAFLTRNPSENHPSPKKRVGEPTGVIAKNSLILV